MCGTFSNHSLELFVLWQNGQQKVLRGTCCCEIWQAKTRSDETRLLLLCTFWSPIVLVCPGIEIVVIV